MKRFLLVLVMMTAFTADAPSAAMSAGPSGFAAVVRAEARASVAGRGRMPASADRDQVLARIRNGAASLRSTALAAMVPDSLYGGPLEPPPTPRRRQGQWGNRIVKATSIASVTLSLAGIAASVRDASESTRSTLALSAGAIGGAGALFNLLRPRAQPPPAVDPNERMRTMFRALQLGDAFGELRVALSGIASEMEAIAAVPATTDSAMVIVARRYVSALGRAQSVFDVQLPHAANVAREASAHAGFSPGARARLGRLAAQVDRTVDEWRQRRWVIAGEERVTLEWLGGMAR